MAGEEHWGYLYVACAHCGFRRRRKKFGIISHDGLVFCDIECKRRYDEKLHEAGLPTLADLAREA